MAPRRCNVDNEAGLRKMLESVLDSDCENSELSDDEIESVECVSNSDSSSNAVMKVVIKMTRSYHEAKTTVTGIDDNPVTHSFTDNSGACENLTLIHLLNFQYLQNFWNTCLTKFVAKRMRMQ
ncbi:hypothetical protein C0J52_01575 [Blattella germanica]|nr:hypothetical protein C0J52_01575 [Blattella germanica]